jgi:hypothetical protein
MKNLVFIIVGVIALSISAYAQINVSCSGTVGIMKPTESQYSLSTDNIYLPNGPYVGLILSKHPGNAYMKSIWPTSDYQGYLGLPDKRFQYVYCKDLIKGSDKRDKENF